MDRQEMPKYQSHKKVWALKIEIIIFDRDLAKLQNRDTTGTATIKPSDKDYQPFQVDAGYVRKHAPEAGGYFVQYEGGYKSYSPAEEFEKGYTKI